MPSVTATCPHCFAQNSHFISVSDFYYSPSINRYAQQLFEMHAAMKCNACGFLVVAVFNVHGKPDNVRAVIAGHEVNISEVTFESSGHTIILVGIFPSPEKASSPPHCPENVERAFLDAEKARLAGIFPLAAAGYRKTVDRAITPLMPQDGKRRMLGHKLAEIEKSDLLPKPMRDWISAIKDDGNSAMHDDDKDFEAIEEVEPARKFTLALLQYLFTLPQEVNDARNKSNP